ncbi:MAG TPA: winged helix DNA-binding domain-containing protein [Solirubrobacteraceae bacterium]|nr:winged helix DNA-binding domain-containing protein [Solirubrobacteraceae bacterium]
MLARVETLSRRDLNRALLARQGLLEPLDLPLPAALEAVCGIQAQYAPSMYIGLWSRLHRFARDDLTRALEQRAVVQATLLRVTIHAVSPADFWAFALATRTARRRWWLRAMRADAPPEAELERAAERLRAALAGGATLRRTEIEALVGKVLTRGVGLWVDLVRVPPAGTWERRRADVFGLAEDWIGPPAVRGDPVEHLVTRYLRAFGPASRNDVASFTGLKLGDLRPALAALELVRYASEDGEELLDVPGGALPGGALAAPVRFLPTWDAALLVHARRTGVLPERFRRLVFHTRNPHSVPTFLVDGEVAGAWKHEDGAIRLDPFEPLPPAAREAVEAEAVPLAGFHA